MEIMFLSFICSISYLVILCKMFSLKFVVKTQVLWDIVFTFGMPVLFTGTFSGMATAFIAGILFSCMTYLLAVLSSDSTLVRLFSIPYGKETNTTSSYHTHPPRFRRR